MPRKSYPLNQCRLFKVTSPVDLASRLGVSIKALEALTVDEGNYKIFPVEQKGKIRMVQKPSPPLQKLHARVHEFLSRIETPDYLHSAIKERSYISNARAHLDEGNLIKVDVKKFFRSVPKAAVYNFFREHLQCAEHVSGLLANLLTIEGHLPTGSSSSPIMSYYAFKEMFDAIHDLAHKRDCRMTCYIDDIAISGPQASPKMLYEVRQMIARSGLKSHKIKYFPARKAKIVTGVAIQKGKALLPNRRHLLIKQGYDALNAASLPKDKLEVLKGLTSRVHEAAQIDPEKWLSKAKELQKIQQKIKKTEV